jgi:hypothetical protein
MSTQIKFKQIQSYLDAIAANANLDVVGSPHKSFWNVPYTNFINGVIPKTKCKANPIPIINRQDPENSLFYVILTNAQGFCNIVQMPPTGPYITDAGYSVTLPDGTVVTGAKIQQDIHEWLTNGYPENV